MIKLLELNLYFTEHLTKHTYEYKLVEDFEEMHKEFLETFGKLANKQGVNNETSRLFSFTRDHRMRGQSYSYYRICLRLDDL